MKARAWLSSVFLLAALGLTALLLSRKQPVHASRASSPPQLCVQLQHHDLQDTGTCKITTDALDDSHSQEAVLAFSTSLLNSLTSGSTRPEWEIWETKRTLALEPVTESTVTGMAPDSSLPLLNPPLGTHFEIPKQNNVAPAKLADGSVTGPQVDTVYYNSFAAEGVRNANSSRTGGVPQFPSGSVIVKTVWEILPDPTAKKGHRKKTATDAAPWMDITRLTPEGERIWRRSSKRLFPRQFKRVRYGVEGAGCSALSNEVKAISGYCAYAMGHITQEHLETKYPWRPYCEKGCIAVLAGLNIMVRPSSGAEWIWITAWLSGQKSNSLPNDPWKNYSISASDQERSVLRVTESNKKVPNYLFDPYLEGAGSSLGEVSNCKNCHSYAAYDRTSLAEPPNARDKDHGEPDKMAAKLFGPPALPTKCDTEQKVCDYLQSVVRTDFVWSLAAAAKSLPHRPEPRGPLGSASAELATH